jgi:hypothetical protein
MEILHGRIGVTNDVAYYCVCSAAYALSQANPVKATGLKPE